MLDVDKVVDIDTSGPGAEVELDSPKDNSAEDTYVEDKTPAEDKSHENERETKLEDGGSADDAIAKSDEPTDVQDNEENTEKKKELEEYSDGVKRRIAKLTKKMREAERREEAATVYAKSVLAEKEKLNSRLTKLDTGFVSEKENRIKSGMEAAVSKLAKAREENDLKAEVSASAEISKLGYEEARLADLKARQADQKATQALDLEKQQYQQVEEPRRVDSRARDWAQKNSTWFNRDPVMTEGAKVIHRQLTEVEGYDPNTDADEYYTEVDRRIRVEFPHKFDIVSDSTNKPTQTVASATRSSKTSGRKIVKLSPSQVAIAKKLGVPLKDYAEQLKITEGV
jgi:hypothetical protein